MLIKPFFDAEGEALPISNLLHAKHLERVSLARYRLARRFPRAADRAAARLQAGYLHCGRVLLVRFEPSMVPVGLHILPVGMVPTV